jgi:hypothetical protein
MAEADKGAASGVRLGVGRARATRAWHACAQPRERDRDSAAGAPEMFVPPCDDDAGTRGAAPRHACRDPLLPFPQLISAPRIRAHAAFFADPARVASVSELGARARPVAATMGSGRDQKFTAATRGSWEFDRSPRLFAWQ